jgi:hypothetical protein
MSSQGTAVYVAKPVAAGGATDITVTAITKTNPAVVAAAGNNLLSGMVGKFSGATGMTQINGLEGIVSDPSSTDFDAFNIDATGFTTYTSGGKFTPYEMLKACEIRDMQLPGGQSPEIAVSTICSTAAEYRIGLIDYGEATMNVNFVPGDPAQWELLDASQDGTSRWFTIVFPEGRGAAVFQAFVRQFGWNFGVNAAYQGTIGLRLTGPIQYVDIVPPPGVSSLSSPSSLAMAA